MDQPVETWTVRVDADLGNFERELESAAGSGRQFGHALTTAFQGVAIQGKSVTESIHALALSLSKLTLQAAFKPVEEAVGGFIKGLIGGGFSFGGATAGGVTMPFARGGVISSPIAFPLQGGATGIAGERGAEAIMPLARGSDGRLGVKTNGGGSSVSVTFNVTTPDAESFRRTEAQVSAMLARAVSQGQRNL